MIKLPITIDLTPNHKTLICLYPSPIQGKLVARCLDIFGEPEMICPSDADPDNILILFPHQNMPEELKEVAERMSTANLLKSLGYEPEGGFMV
jgi:hypothetical protein